MPSHARRPRSCPSTSGAFGTSWMFAFTLLSVACASNADVAVDAGAATDASVDGRSDGSTTDGASVHTDDGGADAMPLKGMNASRPPDGAPGACCAPSTGGCADLGGYQADGDCTRGRICDNMCEQEIVDDVHGCKKMIYKLPPTPTTIAGTGKCDAPPFVDAGADGQAKSDAGDAGSPADASEDAGPG
ncbi:MAG: hypothetical protein U0169_15680 [Polyangiaceae bacterium]